MLKIWLRLIFLTFRKNFSNEYKKIMLALNAKNFEICVEKSKKSGKSQGFFPKNTKNFVFPPKNTKKFKFGQKWQKNFKKII